MSDKPQLAVDATDVASGLQGVGVDPQAVLGAIRLKVRGTPELGMWRPAVFDLLDPCSPAVTSFVIDHLIRGGVTGDETSFRALLAVVVEFIHRERDSPETFNAWRRAVYEAAVAEQRDHVCHILVSIPPHRRLKDTKGLQRPRFDRDVSLGERKQLAAGPNRAVLENLLLDIDPHVVRKLCANPHVHLEDILSVVTRRPNLPEVITEVALSTRWIVDYRIRQGIVLNPYAPTGLALTLLPLLRGTDMRQVSYAQDLHPMLHRASMVLMALRATRRIKPV